jgi:hypothetical protein
LSGSCETTYKAPAGRFAYVIRLKQGVKQLDNNKKNKKSSNMKDPTLDNDQLGENASGDPRAYTQKGRSTTDKKKKK